MGRLVAYYMQSYLCRGKVKIYFNKEILKYVKAYGNQKAYIKELYHEREVTEYNVWPKQVQKYLRQKIAQGKNSLKASFC